MRSHSHSTSFTLCLCALLLSGAWTSLPQESRITATGLVTNGTPGGTVPPGLKVSLHVFSGEEEVGVHSATLASDGSFQFGGLVAEGEETFVARVVYQDVIYLSDLTTLEPGQRELSLPVVIYESTEDPAAVSITQFHFFVFKTEGRLLIEEYALISNAGDRTYVGARDIETGRRATLSFVLPDGASGLWFEGPGLEERYLVSEGGFTDTEPVLPGTRTSETDYGYELAYREGTPVVRAFGLPVDAATLVFSGEGEILEDEGLELAGSMDTQMGPALYYVAGPLAAGEPLVFTVAAASPPTAQAAAPATRSPAREVAVGLMALAAAVVVVYLLYRSPAPGPLPARARPLVEAIAALDADFEAGRLDEKPYHRERERLKQQIGRAEPRDTRG